jgi:predicted phosphohydrolase
MSVPVYAISDLHFSTTDPSKTMTVFGEPWTDHPERLISNWNQEVPENAIVLIPGDLSWGLQHDAVLSDWTLINSLSGRTLVISPGNHDYCLFKTQGKARTAAAELTKLMPVKNDAVRLAAADGVPGIVVAAVRGFLTPEDVHFAATGKTSDTDLQAQKLFKHEISRLRSALSAAHTLLRAGDQLIVMVHYPPFANLDQDNEFTGIIRQSGAVACVYGHLHGARSHRDAFQGVRDGVLYKLVSCDALDMHPYQLGLLDTNGLSLTPTEQESDAACCPAGLTLTS